jgi:hypothetical protein
MAFGIVAGAVAGFLAGFGCGCAWRDYQAHLARLHDLEHMWCKR